MEKVTAFVDALESIRIPIFLASLALWITSAVSGVLPDQLVQWLWLIVLSTYASGAFVVVGAFQDWRDCGREKEWRRAMVETLDRLPADEKRTILQMMADENRRCSVEVTPTAIYSLRRRNLVDLIHQPDNSTCIYQFNATAEPLIMQWAKDQPSALSH